MIYSNAHKYPISAQCRILGIARSTYYYELKASKTGQSKDYGLDEAIERIYRENRSVYGARKIKRLLDKERERAVSRRKITEIMKKRSLVSACTKKKYRPTKSKANKAATLNLVDRGFKGRKPLETLVSDLSYVRVANTWNYTCLLLDLYNREIVGHSAGIHKDAALVKAAFASMDVNLFDVEVFHTDQGSEFDNMTIDEVLDTFSIKRSLSRKSNPWDNAVSEATFKLYKAEFAYREKFNTIRDLQIK